MACTGKYYHFKISSVNDYYLLIDYYLFKFFMNDNYPKVVSNGKRFHFRKCSMNYDDSKLVIMGNFQFTISFMSDYY